MCTLTQACQMPLVVMVRSLRYSQTILDFAMDRLLILAGGCYGTFLSHSAAVVKKVDGCTIRICQSSQSGLSRALSQKRLASNDLVKGAI